VSAAPPTRLRLAAALVAAQPTRTRWPRRSQPLEPPFPSSAVAPSPAAAAPTVSTGLAGGTNRTVSPPAPAGPWPRPHSHHPERPFRHPSQPAQPAGTPLRRRATAGAGSRGDRTAQV